MANTKFFKVVCLLMIVLWPCIASADDFELRAYVDNETIQFGSSLRLTVETIVSVGGSLITTSNNSPPTVDSIPGFDIVATSRRSQTRIINNVGQSISSVVYELVPRDSGKHIIPAFTMQGSDGETYSTEPIEVEALARQQTQESVTEEISTKSRNFGSYLFIIALITAAVVYIALSLLKSSDKNSQKNSETLNVEPDSSEHMPQSDKSTTERVETDFKNDVCLLLEKHPEKNSKFFSEFFELLKQNLVNSGYSESLTFDEILSSVSTDHNDLKEHSDRLKNDLEKTLYADMPLSRSIESMIEDSMIVVNTLKR